ncbi:hypothetical protein YC2023_108515 [Brassica napus]
MSALPIIVKQNSPSVGPSGRVALLPRSTEIQPFATKIRPSPFVRPVPGLLTQLDTNAYLLISLLV